jgi:hypothetical protein
MDEAVVAASLRGVTMAPTVEPVQQTLVAPATIPAPPVTTPTETSGGLQETLGNFGAATTLAQQTAPPAPMTDLGPAVEQVEQQVVTPGPLLNVRTLPGADKHYAKAAEIGLADPDATSLLEQYYPAMLAGDAAGMTAAAES